MLLVTNLCKYVFQNIAYRKCFTKPTSYFQRASLMFSSVNQVIALNKIVNGENWS